MKKLLLVGLVAVAIVPIQVGAYGVETHAAITQEMARFFNQHYPNRAFTIAEMQILMQGAIDEDDGLRMLNHFYDPIHKKGLTFLGTQHLASRNWAQNSTAQAGLDDNALALVLSPDDYNSSDYAWKRAVEDYARGKTERGLEGLGHILHLIEDLTVPAHVRNDPHPPKGTLGEQLGDDDPYELWSHKINRKNINLAARLRDKKPVSGLGSLDNYFDELAEYTNTKFFSKDTITGGYFSSPGINKLVVVYEKGNDQFLGIKNGGEQQILAKRKKSVVSDIVSDPTTDDSTISQSTWDHLSLKAVQYGAGAIDLFFQEVEKLKSDPDFSMEAPKSLLGQFIDTIGENIGALVEGPPAAQEPIIVKAASEPVEPDVVVEEPPIIEPQPIVVAPIVVPVIITDTEESSSASTDDEEDEPVSQEEQDEPESVSEEHETLDGEPPKVIAEPEVVLVPDVTPPNSIDDLSAIAESEDVISLTWTTPSGNVSPTGYALRYSETVITEENWESALVIADAPITVAPGESETFTIANLNPETTYYFALKTVDEAGNWSGMSNVVSAETLIGIPNYPVISEIFPDMPGADTGEFVELYNPTDVPYSLAGHSLQYLSGAATDFTKTARVIFGGGATIPAKGFYMVMTGYLGGSHSADVAWRETLHNTGATLFLVDHPDFITGVDDEDIIDRVAYGTGTGVLAGEGEAAVLPGEGKSIERRALVGGVCFAAADAREFSGNGCDTGNNALDFDVKNAPKAQKASSLFEPRVRPTDVTGDGAILNYDEASRTLRFAWSPSKDASNSSSGITYRIMNVINADVPTQLYNGTATSYTRTPEVVGVEYKATIQAIDRDGLSSSIVELSAEVPSFIKDFSFTRGLDDASGSPTYAAELSWESYPFIPTGSKWHLVVFYFNEDAKNTPFLGRSNNGHNWGAGITMPSVFKTEYLNCQGGLTKNASALIMPDDAASCSGLIGGSPSHAIDLGLLRDSKITLPVLNQTFGGEMPTTGEDFVTIAFYAYANGNPSDNDMRLVAVDKTRYLLEE